MTRGARSLAAIGSIVTAILVVYFPILTSLVHQWASDDNYSHGFIVAPFAAYFAWRTRDQLAAAPSAPHWSGLVIVAASVCVLLAGLFGAELFLTRVSLVGVIAGAILFVFGARHLRLLAFPVAFLVLMIPLPAVIFNQIAFPLQLFASSVGESVLSLCGVPVLREGNILVLPTTTLEVAQACSGIRSLVSLITLAILLGKFTEPVMWRRVALALFAVPVAIATNAARVAGTGLLADWIGPQAAQGFFHEFSGWVVFVIALALLLAVQRALAMTSRLHVAPTRARLELS